MGTKFLNSRTLIEREVLAVTASWADAVNPFFLARVRETLRERGIEL